MMKEIVQLYDGGCGDRLGSQFCRMISQEHGLTPDGMVRCGSWRQMERLPVMFYEAKDRFHPRSVMVREGVTTGVVMDMIRRQVEMCDSLQGFTFCHSMSPSEGGMIGEVLTSLRDEFSDSVIATFSVMGHDPDVMMLHNMINMTDINIMFDNRTIHDICVSQLGLASPSYSDINHLISQVMSGVTASLRFPAPDLNNPITDLQQLKVNSVPAPGLQFLQPSCAPLTICNRGHTQLSSSPSQLLDQLLASKHNLTSSAAGTKLTMTSTFRGPMSRAEIEDNIHRVKLPDVQMTSNIVSVCPPCVQSSAVCVTNSTSITRMLSRMKSKYSFKHEKDDLVPANEAVKDVIQKYENQESSKGKL